VLPWRTDAGGAFLAVAYPSVAMPERPIPTCPRRAATGVPSDVADGDLRPPGPDAWPDATPACGGRPTTGRRRPSCTRRPYGAVLLPPARRHRDVAECHPCRIRAAARVDTRGARSAGRRWAARPGRARARSTGDDGNPREIPRAPSSSGRRRAVPRHRGRLEAIAASSRTLPLGGLDLRRSGWRYDREALAGPLADTLGAATDHARRVPVTGAVSPPGPRDAT
jgi:hypothetical protein